MNIEDDIESREEFWKLLPLVGNYRDAALGKLVRFFRLAQRHFGQGTPIPREELDQQGLLSMIESGWAKPLGNGYQTLGAERQFAWYAQKVEAGKRRGKSKRDPGGKFKKESSGTPAEHQRPPALDQPLALSLSLSLSKNKEGNTHTHTKAVSPKSSLREQIQIAYLTWCETLKHLGVASRSINPAQERSLQLGIHSLGLETVCLALEGARYEQKSERFDPRAHLSIDRVLHRDRATGKTQWEKFQNLALERRAATENKVWDPERQEYVNAPGDKNAV